ncbi:BTAD domain-containing putative transcriptional regulator [Kribbella sp. NPDC000426]|uniref:ATP-binding protein n=1 Tax=Kribbella sp. NPDC000426 TaxID=3154255 RepID=UPI003330A6B5
MTETLVPDSAGVEPRGDVASLRLQVLGPLRVWRGGVEVDPGPRQQACLLALLLAREGRPVGAGELIDLIWGENEPASALNVIHKYVGSLRRLLEPALRPRQPGAFLARSTNGYLCTAGPDVLDLAHFRQLVAAARTALGTNRESTALDQYAAALELWSGPAGGGTAHSPAALAVLAGLDDEFLGACVEAAELAISLGRPDRVLPALQLAVSMAPLHEPVHAGLVRALGTAGQQAAALTAYDAIRRRLADDLGIEPGAALRSAQRQVLKQTAEPAPPALRTTALDGELVGRAEEYDLLRSAVEPALAAGTAVVLLEGEPGIGKTRLLQEIACHAQDQAARVFWGHGLQGGGAPAMWPWVEVVRSLLESRSTTRRAEWLTGELSRLTETRDAAGPAPAVPDDGARFRLFEEVVGVISESAAERPLVIVLDDLHWADPASLHLFDHVVARLPAGTAVVAALRNRDPSLSLELARALAAASRVRGHRRLLVGPLAEPGVAELIRRETGEHPTAEVARAVRARTAGNPFFVREVARLLTDDNTVTEESVLRSGVPLTVRDVVRDRMAALDPGVQELLQVAALAGRNVALVLLARIAAADVATCLEQLEPVRDLGLAGPAPGDPFSYCFAHDLVREAVCETIPPGRAASLHRAIADAIEVVGPTDDSLAERVAHHLWEAGPLVDPERTVSALLRAGARATAKTALRDAERHLVRAVERARGAALLEVELDALSRLIAVAGMRSMYGAASVDLLERAETVAKALGRERQAAGFLFSRWTAHVQGLEHERSGILADRLLEQGSTSSDPVVRGYGDAAWGIQQWHLGRLGASYRHLTATASQGPPGDHGPDPVWDGLRMLIAATLAEISAYHGKTARARAALDELVAGAGDDAYATAVATCMAARVASVVGDPDWTLQVADRGIAVDPQFSFVFLGTYLRLARYWALAMTGHDPGAAADAAERLIVANLTNPVRSCVSTWYALLAEMRLAAGDPDAATIALDQADTFRDRYGQRSADGLLLLVRAKLANNLGDPAGAVRLAEQARAVAGRQEAYLFVQRADLVLADLANREPAAGAVHQPRG